VKRVPGGLLIAIVTTTVLAIVVNENATIPNAAWGTVVPKVPSGVVAHPDFGLLGKFSLFGGFHDAGVMTAIVFVFTLILADFFDAMGTIIGVSGEAGLLDEQGRLPNIGRVLFIDGLAASAGGAGSASSNTCFVESAAGVGEGARTGLANVVTGTLLFLAVFFTPLLTIVPSQAAAPALVAVGFLMMTQAKDINWNDWEIAVPAFLTLALMPFTYSITNGIGAGFIMFCVLKVVLGKASDVNWLMWIVAGFFVVYFALDPIKQALGIE
jgi:AGZA family xanthine/uracil permease-like MFS transporter